MLKDFKTIEQILSHQITENSLSNLSLMYPLSSESKNNVFHINNYRKNLPVDKQIVFQKEKPKFQNHAPIFISGGTEDDQRNLALEIHYFLNFKMFVSFADISHSIANPSDITSLTNSTILIHQFDKLDENYKYILLDYLSELRKGDEPLILSTSAQNREEVLSNSLDRYLLKLLSVHNVHIEDSLQKIKQTGITSFLTAAIKKNPSNFLKS